MTGLADSRGTLTVDKEYPAEKNVVGEEPRVGVFVCHCGSNIAGVIDVESVAEYAKQLPGVAFATDTMYTCSSDSLSLIREAIEEHDLNRVVVASCTPRTHEPIFQDTLREAGLNPFLFEMANIRDQASWVHAKEPEKATQKAKELVQMSVARARLLEPLFKVDVPLTHAAVVIGGGVAGMTSALALGDMGHEVHLIERSPKLGGHVLELGDTIKGNDPTALVKQLEQRLVDNPNVKIHLEAELADFHGFIGNFSSVIGEKDGKRTRGRQRRRHRRHRRAWRSAPSSSASAPARRSSPAWTSSSMLKDDDPALADVKSRRLHPLRRLARREQALLLAHLLPQSIKNAIRLKEQDPDRPVYVWFKEVRTFGLLEEYYTKARELGVIFTRYDNDTKPRGQRQRQRQRQGAATRTCAATSTCRSTCSCWPRRRCRPTGGSELSKLLKVPLTADGFYLEAHVKLRPVDFGSRGHLPLRRRPLPQEHRGDDLAGLRRRGSRRGHPGQAGAQGRRRRRRGRHRTSAPPASPACASAPTRCRSSTSRPRRPRSRRPPARAAACASASARSRRSRCTTTPTRRSSPRKRRSSWR